ncbi:single-stranded-DNA-specific exonuclease RecJ [Shewanella xiamenensis]|uniref:single-stranded-DNA-specific exonuclease RecJ n=1 Tax=Shewanella xiamenensis TaxID=332186 RepID=UPI0011869D74|nr:single-stranded-DNA-specific exonuclease RecJ [Shewanella xiamenensis]TVL15724.1 single-stranded-DNA-specific exonuclease RecJ [Shewanella xiamenensis]TVL15998.1 single-stranded-DNA-specific exonuclease RecJ [Shewanella xiamenensis]TVL23616.1 single-stranded-DNA-specific exonuclease RecJ [Shewanella xiamenensis]TVL29999.1 single-stranded-DNA-specific exonuclease RecJ [Shewanella xiamenensis]TVO98969.1 single-stranded-DNA-specific exonuclease RecJ [Shewanella xiamenensis]
MIHKIIRRPTVDDSHLPAHLPPLLRQIYARRGVMSAECELVLKGLLRPDTMKGLDHAAKLIADAMQLDKSILIVGDFDADGATSTSVCILALRMMGASKVDYLIPNRFDYGYGLSPEIVAVAATKQAELLITVDNGISSIEGVAAAKAFGMQVVITDHHLPGHELPAADAIVNPNQPGCQFASKSIAGVGVAFYLMTALRAELRARHWYQARGIAEPNLGTLLDIVALGTVADVVSLDANNRILVEAGLQRVRSGRCRVGITALLEVAKRNPARIVASDFGFAVGPRLNAAGRLDEMALGVETLLCEDIMYARRMAAELDSLNQERRELEVGMQQEALKSLEYLKLNEEQLPWGIALFQEDWHQGVIGILASRIKDKYHRPVIAFADAGNGEIKGSARSIKGLHMRDLLELVNSRHPGLISKFGGHAMAAGLTLKSGGFATFAKAYDDAVRELLKPEQLTGELWSDGELTPTELSLEIAQLLRNAGPWGQSFEEPLFDGYFKITQQRIVGERHLKLVLETQCGTVMLDAIAFNVDLHIWPDATIQHARIVYKLDVNEYRGNFTLQLMVEQIEPM